jgi:biopolymer transport protein ExbB
MLCELRSASDQSIAPIATVAPHRSSFVLNQVLHYVEPLIFLSQGLIGVFGVFLVILVTRKIRQKKFRNQAAADEFLSEVREKLQARDYDGVTTICDSPAYWSKAAPQLILIAMQHRFLSLSKMKVMLSEKFEREILAELSYQHAGMAVVAKTAPMIGLLGTVTGIIGSFSQISKTAGGDPNALAAQIGLALMATMWGLVIAIPMTLLGGFIMVRIGRLTDQVKEDLSQFLRDYEASLQPTKS